MSEELQLVTVIITIVAFGFGVYRYYKKNRRSVRVSCAVTDHRRPPAFLGSEFEYEEVIRIRAVNSGYRPIVLELAGIRMTDGSAFTEERSMRGTDKLPKRLEDSDPVEMIFDISVAQKKLKEREAETGQSLAYTVAFVKDAEGKEYSARVPQIEGLNVASRRWWQFWKR